MRIALVLCLLVSVAHARDMPPSVRVTATATSSLPKLEPALVIDRASTNRTGWCPAKGEGDAITFAFDAAIPITKLAIVIGLDSDTPRTAKIQRVEIKTDAQTLTAELPRTLNDVELDGQPTRTVTVKIAALTTGTGHGCLAGVRFVSPSGFYYQFVYGIDRAAFDELGAFTAALDTALRSCDEAGIAKGVQFPVKHEHSVLRPGPGTDDVDTRKVAYRTAAELAKACRKPGSALALGLAGGDPDATVAADVAHATTEQGGLVRLGNWETHAWTLARTGNRWTVTWIHTSLDTARDPAEDIGLLPGLQLDAWSGHDARLLDLSFAPGAKIALLGPAASVLDAAAAGDALRGVVGATRKTVKDVAIGIARDLRSGWLSFTVKLAAPGASAEYRVSEVVVRDDGKFRVLAGLWSEAQANAAVNKSALAGTTPKIAPIKNAKPDDDVLGAFLTLQKGPLDATAAARKDLVVFGSGPGERTVGGASFARPWASAWANHLPMMGDAIAGKTPSGTTGWFVGDVALEKLRPGASDHYLVPFRLFLVFDRMLDGTWTLVHVHIATPPP